MNWIAIGIGYASYLTMLYCHKNQRKPMSAHNCTWGDSFCFTAELTSPSTTMKHPSSTPKKKHCSTAYFSPIKKLVRESAFLAGMAEYHQGRRSSSPRKPQVTIGCPRMNIWRNATLKCGWSTPFNRKRSAKCTYARKRTTARSVSSSPRSCDLDSIPPPLCRKKTLL